MNGPGYPRRSKKPDWRRIARRRWYQAAWVNGNGPYASLAWCRDLTVTLFNTREEAEQAKRRADELACGGGCAGASGHEVVDLQEDVTP